MLRMRANREEFVVVGWSDPEGSRHRIGALLLGYYTKEGKLARSSAASPAIVGAAVSLSSFSNSDVERRSVRS
jgi:ATP-dependent DNA ligase